jgi:hypothetical protein
MREMRLFLVFLLFDAVWGFAVICFYDAREL